MNSLRFAWILAVAGVAAAGPIYQITDLGSLGGPGAVAFGLNARGQAAGQAATPFGYRHAVWSSGAGMADLTLGSSASEGGAYAINNAGVIAGVSYELGVARATTWNGGAATTIGDPDSFAMAISESGVVSGAAGGHVARWTASGQEDLGTLGGGPWSAAYAINSSGKLAGTGAVDPGVFRAFVWSPDGGYVMLPTPGGASSYGMGLNERGDVAGAAQVASGYLHAFLFSGGALVDLGTLGGGSSYGYGVNDRGDVVGYAWTPAGQDPHAFLYSAGIMWDLNALIGSGSAWELLEAYAINSSGQIVGRGRLGGVEHAFRLDSGRSDEYRIGGEGAAAAPEPATLGIVLLTIVYFGILAQINARRFPMVLARLRPRGAVRPTGLLAEHRRS